MNMIKNKYSFAFTIVELIVVISVIGILAGVTLVSYGSWRTSVATSSVKSDLTHAASAMESSRSFGNAYSATLPTSFTSSTGNTMTLTVTSTTSFCIDGTSSNSATIQYYIDNLTQATGPKIGTCATRTSALLPGVPTGLVINSGTRSSISLSWTASSNATSYTAQCASDSAFIVGSQSTTVSAPTITAFVTGLSFTTSYYCRVNASNASTTSAWSATVGPTVPTTTVASVVTSISLNLPEGITIDASGTAYVADSNSSRIISVTSGSVSSVFAGSGVQGFVDGSVAAAKFALPSGIAIDASGTVYVSDNVNNRIRKISGGVVTTLAGSGAASFADGTGTNAQFYRPYAIAVDTSGTLYVADSYNHRIRKITPAGVVTTLAGSGVAGFADGTGNNAQFKYPSGIAVDTSGTVYVGDSSNNRIRKITPAGVVTTLAGSGVAGFADGIGGSAMFNNPYGLAVDTAGNIYVADGQNQRIREISPNGVVTTLAGSGTAGTIDGSGTTAQFYNPSGIAVDTTGIINVVEVLNPRIRKIQ
jgi:sugar lactone lactonase YvrE/Tfp pilus assembly protein PilE